jgi:nucleoside-diphosphate-sugar epimerase
MSGLRVLFLGGTGISSSACSRLAVERGIEFFVLNRGQTTSRPLPPEATVLRGDARDPASVRDALGGREFDAIVDWVAYTADQVQDDINVFRGRAGQFVFISSASAYQTPPSRVPVVESTPLRNPYLQYSRDKIADPPRGLRAGFRAAARAPPHPRRLLPHHLR